MMRSAQNIHVGHIPAITIKNFIVLWDVTNRMCAVTSILMRIFAAILFCLFIGGCVPTTDLIVVNNSSVDLELIPK